MVYNYDVLNFGGAPEPQASWRMPAMESNHKALESFVSDLLGTSHDRLVLLKEDVVIAEGWFDGITLQVHLHPAFQNWNS
jgi:hypothetical protein